MTRLGDTQTSKLGRALVLISRSQHDIPGLENAWSLVQTKQPNTDLTLYSTLSTTIVKELLLRAGRWFGTPMEAANTGSEYLIVLG